MLFREHSETVRDSTLETAIVHPTNIWILSQTIFRFSLSINLSSGCNQHECLLFLDYVMLSYFCSVEQEKRRSLNADGILSLPLIYFPNSSLTPRFSSGSPPHDIFESSPHKKTHRTSDYRIHLSQPGNRLSQALHLSPVHISAQSFKSFVFLLKNSDGSASRKPSFVVPLRPPKQYSKLSLHGLFRHSACQEIAQYLFVLLYMEA